MIVENHSRSSGKGPPFSNIEFLYSLRPASMKLGLENIKAVLEYFGNPQKRFPAVHVAGTNGKGSTSAFISSILRASSLKTGTFYSPHLFRINERVQLDGKEIETEVLDHYLGELRKIHGRLPFTFFEGMTAAAILYFMDNKVDMAVFEVGLGGRLDATRLVNSVISVITGISVDHTRHLGESRELILREKLGVVKNKVPLVANLDDRSLFEIAHEYCRRTGASIINPAIDAEAELKYLKAEKMLLSLRTNRYDYGEIESGIIGRHQLRNISTAAITVEELSRMQGRALEEYVREGIRKAFLPGRFQVLGGSPSIIMDVAHNEESLLGSLSTLSAISPAERNVILFGCMERKDLGDFPRLARRACRQVLLAPLKISGAADGESLAKRFGLADGSGGDESGPVVLCSGMKEGMNMAFESLGGRDTLLVLGSHHAVEEAVSFIR